MGNFAENTVNVRFRKLFEEMRKHHLIKNKSDLGKKLNTYNHVINAILKGDRKLTVDQILKLTQQYGVSANYLFGLDDEMFVPGHPATQEVPTLSKDLMARGGRQNIVLVPHRAVAGFSLGSQEQDYSEYPRFTIPGYEGDQLFAFEIEGDSMLPTITSGDIVVAERLRKGEVIKDNQVYIVVTDSVVAKRIQLIKEGGQVTGMRLISDNSAVYKPYEVDVNEVRDILKVKLRLTNYAIS